MPSLFFKGPRRILEVDPPNLPLPDDPVYPPSKSPLTPTKHKACRPSLTHASWFLNLGREQSAPSSSAQQQQSKDSSTNDAGGGGITRQQSEGDHDLAAMVHDFIENGCRDRDQCDSDGDSGNTGSTLVKLCDNLKVLASSNSLLEVELLSKVTALLLSLNIEESIECSGSSGGSDAATAAAAATAATAPVECNGACFRQLVAKRLKWMGYDAAICKLKWEISGTVPGGDYEYVDIMVDDAEQQQRLILDLDFRSQFEIARPTAHYKSALKLLPTVYLGSVSRLHNILEVMSEAAKCSLTQNSMHLPPWRTVEYLLAKWFSPHERSSNRVVPLLSAADGLLDVDDAGAASAAAKSGGGGGGAAAAAANSGGVAAASAKLVVNSGGAAAAATATKPVANSGAAATAATKPVISSGAAASAKHAGGGAAAAPAAKAGGAAGGAKAGGGTRPCWEQARRIKEGLRADEQRSLKRGRRGIWRKAKASTNKW